MSERNLDVSQLPDAAFGHRSAAFWGTLGFMAVEGTFFAVMIATYLYGMGRVPEWPPQRTAPPDLLWGVVNTAVLLLTTIPTVIYKRAAARQDAGPARRWALVAALLGTIFIVVRVLEFTTLNTHWTDHFYGSIVWTLLGLHSLHILSDLVETYVLVALCYRRPMTTRRFSDLDDNAMYWFFVLGTWLVVFALLYLVPRLV